MKEVYDFLKNCKPYFLATVENGQPKVRPFGTVDLFEGKLYIQTGKRKDVAKQLLVDPHVEICGVIEKTWIRISAEAVLDENIEAQTHMLDAYPHLKGQYQPGDGNTAVFYLANATAQICSFTEPPRTIVF